MFIDRQLDVFEQSGIFVVRFRRHHFLVDEWVIRSIGDELKEVAARPECRKVVVDFTGVEDLSSFMVGQLVMLRKRMAAKKGQVVLCGLSAEVQEFFDETILSELFDIQADEVDALASLGARQTAPLNPEA